MKKCSKCKIERSLDFYHKRSIEKDGLSRQCNFCKKDYYEKTKSSGYIKNKKNTLKDGYKRKNGYFMLNRKNHANSDCYGKIFQHVFIMSEHLGRPLYKEETVHHKNGIRDDNRIENLELWHKGQPPGQRVEDKINWCIEFIEKYGYKVHKG